jgi:glycosyltransferase involved in cell wall biosynthesis
VKIAIAAIGGFDRSGTERVIPCLLWLVEQLTAMGHEVHVFVPAQEDSPGTWPLAGGTVHNAGRRFWPWRMLAAIVREHRKARFGVIHAFWADMGALAAIAGKLLHVPLVLTLPGGDAVAIPEVGYGALLTLRGRAVLRLAARAAARVTVPSEAMRELAARQGVAAVAVPLGVDTARWPPVPARRRDPSQPLKLLHVASLNRVKDQPTLLEALRSLKARGCAAQLRVIGFDTVGGQVQRLAGELGVADTVCFLDAIPNHRLADHYQWADLLVMTSRHEGAPIVMLEAALAGVPTVGTRVGHIADLTPQATVAVPVADPAALADAIETLARDEPRRLCLAQAAQAFAAENDAAFTARAFEQIYRELTRDR